MLINYLKMSNNYCEKSIWNEFSNSNSSVRAVQDENWRNENYQNNLRQGLRRPKVQQSISTVVQPVHNDEESDDNESTNSISESLNNYLDMKVKHFNYSYTN